jgi:hypothetical protein
MAVSGLMEDYYMGDSDSLERCWSLYSDLWLLRTLPGRMNKLVYHTQALAFVPSEDIYALNAQKPPVEF